MGLATYAEPDPRWMPFVLDNEGYRSGIDAADVDRPNYGPPIIRAWKARFADYFGEAAKASFTYNSSTGRLDPSLEPTQWRQRVASTGQRVLTRVMLHIVDNAVRQTGCRNVVIGGGVGYNCTSNGAIWQSGIVDELYIFPASGDAGTSAGAALQIAAAAGEYHLDALEAAALGASFTDEQIRATVRQTGVTFTTEDDIAGAVADLLVDGKVVGWFQGRAEIGPRALGQRSILASPLTRSMHERVNTIKNREQWRPLAPSMSSSAAQSYLVKPDPVQFMLSAVQIAESVRDEIPAVVHVDGSCRPQVVGDCSRPYRAVLASLVGRGHPEVVLNTSFNLANEPIVNSPMDALKSFYSSGLDALAIGSLLIRK